MLDPPTQPTLAQPAMRCEALASMGRCLIKSIPSLGRDNRG